MAATVVRFLQLASTAICLIVVASFGAFAVGHGAIVAGAMKICSESEFISELGSGDAR